MEESHKGLRRARMRMHEGPLGKYVDAFAKQLEEQGYARESVLRATRLVADFSRWLKRQGIIVQETTLDHTERYLRYRKCHRSPRTEDALVFRRLWELLARQGVVAENTAPILVTPALQLEAEFHTYLEQERRLAPTTIVAYLKSVRLLLAHLFPGTEVQLSTVRAIDMVEFVRWEAARVRPATAKTVITALRSFLGFARYRGFITTDLAVRIPTVANWSMTTIPKTLAPDAVQRLLAHCDRNTMVGRRDYAVLLLLARLGLRAGEVCSLTLDDLDWEAGELRIRDTRGQCDRLPIPQDVGTALVDYLQSCRPPCSTRQVFVRAQAPRREFSNSTAISSIVRRALDRAGLHPALKGAHMLRHSLATQMLRQGASLAEIGQLLRHRRQKTTMIYAKVDLDALRPLALPWPGGVR